MLRQLGFERGDLSWFVLCLRRVQTSLSPLRYQFVRDEPGHEKDEQQHARDANENDHDPVGAIQALHGQRFGKEVTVAVRLARERERDAIHDGGEEGIKQH